MATVGKRSKKSVRTAKSAKKVKGNKYVYSFGAGMLTESLL